MDRNLLILGAGAHGTVIKEIAESMGVFDRIAFLDDKNDIAIGCCDDYKKLRENYTYAHPAFGNHTLRLAWHEKLEEAGYVLPIIKHVSAYVSPSARIGAGTVILPGAVVNARTMIEEECIIDCGAVIDHDVKVYRAVHVGLRAILTPRSEIGPCIDVKPGEII